MIQISSTHQGGSFWFDTSSPSIRTACCCRLIPGSSNFPSNSWTPPNQALRPIQSGKCSRLHHYPHLQQNPAWRQVHPASDRHLMGNYNLIFLKSFKLPIKDLNSPPPKAPKMPTKLQRECLLEVVKYLETSKQNQTKTFGKTLGGETLSALESKKTPKQNLARSLARSDTPCRSLVK